MKVGTQRRAVCLLAMALMLVGCGKKRPPAVTTANPGSGSGRTTGAQPLGDGPDVRPLNDEGALGTNMLSDANGEGGPLADIHFGYDESDLSAEAKAALDQHAQWLQAHRTTKVRVEGHCDERGTVEYNLALGDKRAQAARDYLASHGVDGSRLSVVSYGKERPIDTGRDDAAYSRNRRDHFNVSQ